MPLTDLVSLAAFLALLGCSLMAGTFFAFSSFVMRALMRVPAATGMASMQSINVAVLNPWFLIPFLGTAAACLFLAIYAVVRWQEPAAGWLLAGSLLYVFGNFVMTVAFHVPRNEALGRVDVASPEAAGAWSAYVPVWLRGNHVRAATALAAAASFTVALCRLAAAQP